MRCFYLCCIAVGLVGCGRQMLYPAGSDELGRAIYSGSTTEVDKLSGDLNEKVPIGAGSPMHIAAEQGDVPMLDYLLKHGGQLELRGGHFDEGTPLGTAAAAGKLEAVKFLLAKGANPNGLGSKGEVPLDRAATVEVAQYLLDHGADINAKNKWKSTPLDGLVASPRDRKVAVFLIARGASPASLCLPAMNGDLDMMQRLLDAGAPVDGPSQGGGVPLHFAVGAWSMEAAKWLLAHGADIDKVDRWGDTALLKSAMRGEGMTRFLIEHGANVNLCDSKKRSPLHLAAASGSLDDIRDLLAAKANIEARDEHGWTPLFRAVTNERKDAVRLLIEKGADIDAKDNTGLTASDWAKSLDIPEMQAFLQSLEVKR